jgi:hypothetical protein
MIRTAREFVYFGDVRVGYIGIRAGVPVDSESVGMEPRA